jgi:hypothetical protein
MSNYVGDNEELIRALFADQMVTTSGDLTTNAFPVDELIEKENKSVSVDRESLLSRKSLIKEKIEKNENPNSKRAKWGYATGLTSEIRNIESQCGKKVFEIYPDPISKTPADPWDNAHAKIVRADQSFSKGFIRGYRDKLIAAFQKNVTKLF